MFRPYEDQPDMFNDNMFIRTFHLGVKDEDLVWHRDYRTRVVRVLEGENWKYQEDNELPVELIPGEAFTIEKEIYHRLHKGKGKLKLEIIEYE